MPRKEQKLSVEQIQQFLDLTANESNEIIRAVRDFLKAELVRRENAGLAKPKTSELTRREQNRRNVANYRERQKLLKNKEK